MRKIASQFKILTLALIFSGALNIGLLAAFAFFAYEKTSIATTRVGKKEMTTTNGEIFASMSRLSFRELISFLTNREFVEEGYTKRDLAVAALVAYHHFNLEKALSSPPSQVRTLVLSGGESVDLFPSLSEEEFEAIIRFAYQEKWPLTAKGLFTLLRAHPSPREESLEQAFILTPEFHALQTLFQKTKVPQESAVLLDLVVEGNWDVLDRFFKEQSNILDFSEERRRSLLLEYLSLRSSLAAQLLLATDFSHVLKRFEDRQILEILSLLKKETKEARQFCLELLRSPRNDAIWETAAQVLYVYAGEKPVLPVDPQIALARFDPEKAKKPISTTSFCFHVVKQGESLWKISRQYGVKVDEIVQINGLENSSLFPGMTLKLPFQGTGSIPPR